MASLLPGTSSRTPSARGTRAPSDAGAGCTSYACSKTPLAVGGLSGVTLIASFGSHTLTAGTGSASAAYDSDALRRVTADGATVFGYDAAGNRIVGGATSYTYDKADRISGATTGGVTTAYTVDERGDLVGRGSDCFAYDQADRLTRFVAGAACANPSPTATYAYDGVGKRTSKTVNGVTTSYTYDAARGLPVVIDDGTRKYVWGPAGLAYSVDAAGVATTHHADALGSIRALSDASGATVATFSRDAWATRSRARAARARPSASPASSSTPRPASSTCARGCMTRRSGGSCSGTVTAGERQHRLPYIDTRTRATVLRPTRTRVVASASGRSGD